MKLAGDSQVSINAYLDVPLFNFSVWVASNVKLAIAVFRKDRSACEEIDTATQDAIAITTIQFTPEEYFEVDWKLGNKSTASYQESPAQFLSEWV